MGSFITAFYHSWTTLSILKLTYNFQIYEENCTNGINILYTKSLKKFRNNTGYQWKFLIFFSFFLRYATYFFKELNLEKLHGGTYIQFTGYSKTVKYILIIRWKCYVKNIVKRNWRRNFDFQDSFYSTFFFFFFGSLLSGILLDGFRSVYSYGKFRKTL